MLTMGWVGVGSKITKDCSTRHVVMGAVGIESDSTLERDCRMQNVIDHDTTMIVIECKPSRDWA